MSRDPFQYFRIEARELLEQMIQVTLKLESGAPAKDGIASLLRLAHTLKGAARVVKQSEIADRAHAIEDLLAPLRETAGAISSEQVSLLLKTLDEIQEKAASLSLPAVPLAAASARTNAAVPVEVNRTVRAEVSEMDDLLEAVTEAHSHLSVLRAGLQSVERASTLAELLREQLSRTSAAPAERKRGRGGAHAAAEELKHVFGSMEQDWTRGIEHLDRELRQIRETSERLRLVEASHMFNVLERTARDAAQAQGKQVIFEARGAGVRLDAQILEGIQSGMLQAVRNAVAHGIETADQRRGKNKAAHGKVTVDAVLRGGHVTFICKDDGRGIDLDAVKKALQQKGLLSAGDDRSDPNTLIELLLKSGISTSGTITEVSGRGVGMDVIQNSAKTLGGTVSIKTSSGVGTEIEFLVPLFVAAFDVLVVEAADRIVNIPLDAVRSCKRFAIDELSKTPDGELLTVDDMPIEFVPLGRLLSANYVRPAHARSASAVVIESTHGTVAFGVDRLRGISNIVLRPLPELATNSPLIAGACLDAEGDPQLVLDAEMLVMESLELGAIETTVQTHALPILIIDDSLTTRMLERRILESAGYEVELAASGEEGLEKALQKQYALFLVDVEMPGIDGFTFIERTKSEPQLRDIPAILVSSRCLPSDFERGVKVGAKAYIVKGEFDQKRLLEIMRNLIRH